MLVEALSQLADLSWRLTVAGDRRRDPAAAARLDKLIAHHRLDGRIDVPGKVSPGRLAALYDSADAFVLASEFEGYGMAFAEAMAHGLPVLATNAPAIPGTVPEGAGILVAPENTTAFADALCKLMHDAGLRRQMADVGWAHAQGLPSWKDTAGIIAGVIRDTAPAQRENLALKVEAGEVVTVELPPLRQAGEAKEEAAPAEPNEAVAPARKRGAG